VRPFFDLCGKNAGLWAVLTITGGQKETDDTNLPDCEGSKVRRTGIFVETATKMNQAPSGATSAEYAAPTGLKFYFDCGSTNMSRRRRWGFGMRKFFLDDFPATS
jgi:hypothetical protein